MADADQPPVTPAGSAPGVPPDGPGRGPHDANRDRLTPDRAPDVPTAVAAPRRRWSLSLVWLIPLVAALVGGWTAVKLLRERGTTVTISFLTAEGIEAGRTRLKYKNVDIGQVKQIGFSPDRSQVIVTAEIARSMAALMVEDTRFWVVRPRVQVSGVSGLGTLLSGSYIAVDAGRSEVRQSEFTGLEAPPVVVGDNPGRQFLLRGEDLGSLDIGSPVYYRRIQVGRVTGFGLSEQGLAVDVHVFIQSPYDSFVDTQTRFWKASGIDLRIDASGLKLDMESLQTLVLGGIAFQSPDGAPPGERPPDQFTFVLATDRVAAMRQPDLLVERAVLDFRDSLRGLSPGAPVDFRGITIGEVRSIGLEYVGDDRQVRFPVMVDLYPDRLRPRNGVGTGAAAGAPPARDVLRRLIARGLRAQLRTGNLLTGQVYIAFDFFPNARPVAVDLSQSPFAVPTVPGSLADLQQSVTSIVHMIEGLPLDEFVGEANSTLKTLRATLVSAERMVQRIDRDVAPDLKATMQDARRALAGAERALAAVERATATAEGAVATAEGALRSAGRTLDPQAPLQLDLRSAVREVTRAARSVRELTDFLEQHPESLLRGRREDRQ